MPSLNLTRIDSRNRGAGKSLLLVNAAIGASIMEPDLQYVLILPEPEHYVRYMTDRGIFPLNLIVMGESDAVNYLTRESRYFQKFDRIFLEGLRKWDKIMDGLVAMSKIAKSDVYVTAIRN